MGRCGEVGGCEEGVGVKKVREGYEEGMGRV